jgi:hypothetical protein
MWKGKARWELAMGARIVNCMLRTHRMCTSRLDSEDILAMSLVGAFALLPRRKCSGVLEDALVGFT